MDKFNHSTIEIVETRSRKSSKRRWVGTAIFCSFFVFIFTLIFYLGYVLLISMTKPVNQSSDESASPQEVEKEKKEEETETSGERGRRERPAKKEEGKDTSANGPNASSRPTRSSNAPSKSTNSQREPAEERDVSPFSNVFEDEPVESREETLVQTLREWRDKLRKGLAQASALSKRERTELRIFAREALDYVSFYEDEKSSRGNLTRAERELLAEVRRLAERCARELEPESSTPTEPPLMKEGYSLTPFDRSITRIPPGYKGHDIISVVAALAEHGVCATSRQSSESDRAYATRLERLERELAQEPLFGETTFNSRFAFVIPNFEVRASADGADVVQIKYSSTRKSASIQKDEFASDVSLYRKIIPDFERMRAENSVPTLSYTLGSEEDSSVRPFGLRYQIESSSDPSRVRLFGLAIKLNKKTFDRAYDKFHLRLNRLAPEQGEELARNGCVLCVCALDAEGTNDYYSLRVSNGKMLDDIGVSLYTQTDYLLTVSDVEFWLYNGKTGEVYAKYSCEDALKGKTHYYDAASDGN